jgi:hypothetical protein
MMTAGAIDLYEVAPPEILDPRRVEGIIPTPPFLESARKRLRQQPTRSRDPGCSGCSSGLCRGWVVFPSTRARKVQTFLGGTPGSERLCWETNRMEPKTGLRVR